MMGNPVVQTPVNPAASIAPPSQKQRAGVGWLVKKILKALASLRLTVALFALAIGIVFIGTLAQIDAGIWTVVNKYFRSVYVWVPLQVFFQRDPPVSGGFPYPGGWLIGGLLLVNLLAAHAVRFKLSWKRSGILLIHSGLIVMMVGELVTGLFAVESKMSLAIGESANFVDVSNAFELALIDSTDPKEDDVVVVPDSLLRKGGVIRSDLLPVDVRVVDYMKNSDLAALRESGEGREDTVTDETGQPYHIVRRPEGTGVSANQREDAPSVRVEFLKKGTNESLGSFLLSLWFYPNFTLRQVPFPTQHLTVDGKTYAVEFRPKRINKTYSIQLEQFRHEKYIGTDTPKDFASTVRLKPERGEEWETRIYMNNPLRYSGETFYQSGFFPDDSGTVLQVVRNPGWLMPYFSCAMVAGGMLIHFGMNLIGFLRRRAAL
jgi:hypothetical protein